MAVEPLALPPSTKAMVPRTDGNRAEILQKWLVWYYLVTKNETHLPTGAGFRNHPQYEQVSGSIGNPLIHIFSWSTPNMASYHKSPLPLILFDLLQGVVHITGFYQLYIWPLTRIRPIIGYIPGISTAYHVFPIQIAIPGYNYVGIPDLQTKPDRLCSQEISHMFLVSNETRPKIPKIDLCKDMGLSENRVYSQL